MNEERLGINIGITRLPSGKRELDLNLTAQGRIKLKCIQDLNVKKKSQSYPRRLYRTLLLQC